MLSLLTLVALTQTDGGTELPPELPALTAKALYGACPDASDAGLAFPTEVRDGVLHPVHAPDGGNDWYLPYPRGQRVACLLETCRMRDRQLEPLAQFDGVTLIVIGAVAGAAIAGSVVGIAVWASGAAKK